MEQDDLHALIHSLSRAEKKYFRQYANASTNTAYLKLFEMLDRQETPNEKMLAKKFPKNYHYLRHYLYRLILQSLTVFEAEDDTQLQSHALFSEMVILFRKSLFRACQRHLTRLKKMADERENFALLLVLVNWQRKLDTTTDFKNTNTLAIREFEEEVELLNTRFVEWNYLTNLSHRLFHFMRIQGTPAAVTSHNVYDELLPKLQKMDPEKLLSVRAKLEFHHVLGSTQFGKRKFEQALYHIQQEIEIILAHPKVFYGEGQVLTSRFNNILAICVDLQRWDMLAEYLEKMRLYGEQKEVKQNPVVSFRIRERLVAFRLRQAVDCAQTETLEDLEAAAQPLLEGKDLTASFGITFCLYFSILNLMAMKSERANYWLRKLQYETNQEVRKDLHAYARIVELLLAIDEGNPVHIESVFRSAKRQLQQTDHFNAAEQTFFHWLLKVPVGGRKAERKEFFESFAKALQELVTHSRSSPAIDKLMEVWVAQKAAA